MIEPSLGLKPASSDATEMGSSARRLDSRMWKKVSRSVFGVALLGALSGVAMANDVTAADIEKMLNAKISDSIIVGHVRQSGKAVILTVDDIIRLKSMGAGDGLLQNIQLPQGVPAGVVDPPPAGPRGMEVGVYAKKGEDWLEIATEVVNFKTSGILKAYTFRQDVNGKINGASSRTTLKTPIEIFLVTAEGISATEFQLVRLREKDTYREFRVASAGLGGAKSGVERDAVAFDHKKLGPGRFKIALPSTVVAGEYAFIPPTGTTGTGPGGAGAALGKAYTFRVLE